MTTTTKKQKMMGSFVAGCLLNTYLFIMRFFYFSYMFFFLGRTNCLLFWNKETGLLEDNQRSTCSEAEKGVGIAQQSRLSERWRHLPEREEEKAFIVAHHKTNEARPSSEEGALLGEDARPSG